MAKKNKWTYNKSATITINKTGETESFATQLYSTGVYIIWNNNASQQGGMSPAQLETLCKELKKDSNLTVEFGPEIMVEKVDSLYVERS